MRELVKFLVLHILAMIAAGMTGLLLALDCPAWGIGAAGLLSLALEAYAIYFMLRFALEEE